MDVNVSMAHAPVGGVFTGLLAHAPVGGVFTGLLAHAPVGGVFTVLCSMKSCTKTDAM